MEQPAQAVEAEVRDVLRDRVAITQPLLDRLEKPVAELVPREGGAGVDRILEREVLDPACYVLGSRGEPGQDPSILEVPPRLERPWHLAGRAARRAEHESRRVPELVAEAPVAFDAAFVEAHILARHRDRRR